MGRNTAPKVQASLKSLTGLASIPRGAYSSRTVEISEFKFSTRMENFSEQWTQFGEPSGLFIRLK